MSRKRAVTLIIILSLILSGLLFINYNMTRPTKLNKIIASKYNAPANSAFNDQNFYNCVVDSYNSYADYHDIKKISYTTKLSDDQLKNFYDLACISKKIKSIKGIEKLTNLRYLDVKDNQITSLDVSKNTNLTYLKVYDNQITNLDVSKNIKLETLDVTGNKITNLDVSKNIKLEKLNVTGNKITSLDVSKNIKLETLDVGNISMTNGDATEGNNKITNLDVSKNTNLTYLNAFCSGITSLDVSKNINLTYLYVSCNKITSLDVSKNINLTSLDVSYTKITSLDVSKNIKLETLDVNDNKITSLDVSKNLNLTDLFAGRSQLTSLDVSKNVKLTQLDVSDNQLTNLKLPSISGNKLEKLYVSNNKLTSLDVSKNPNLTYLNVEFNQLTNLDLRYNSKLIDIYVGFNTLKNVILRNIKSLDSATLTDIVDYNPNLQSLTLGNNDKLKSISISGTDLRTIDLGQQTNLKSVIIRSNANLSKINFGNIKNVTKLVLNNNALTTSGISGLNSITNLEGLDLSNNRLTSLSVINLKKLKVLYAGNQRDSSNNRILKTLTLPDSNTLTNLRVGNNLLTELNLKNYTNLTELYANNNSIKNLDLRYNSKLEIVDVSSKELSTLVLRNIKSLDSTTLTNNVNGSPNLQSLALGNNDKLTSILISGTNLKSIYLGQQTNLKSVTIRSNPKLSKIDFGTIKNVTKLVLNNNALTTSGISGLNSITNLEGLDLNNNRLTSLSVINLKKLKVLYAGNQRDSNNNRILTKLTLPNSNTLTNLRVGNNNLTELNLKNYINLTELYANNNSIKNLDLRYNSKLETIDVSSKELNTLVLQNIRLLTSTILTNNVKGCPNLQSLTLGNNDKLTSVSINNSNLEIIDLGVQQNLKTVIVNNNPKLSKIGIGSAKNITRLILNNNALIKEGLNGLNKLSNLYELNLSNNNIKAINITGLTNLITFEISNQKDNDGNKVLTSVVLPNDNTVEKKNKLENLNVSNNNLRSIDLSKSTSLKKLSLCDNPYNLGTISVVTGNSVDITKSIDTNNIILNKNMTKKFKAAFINNNLIDNNIINIEKDGTYNYLVVFEVTLNGINEDIVGTYTVKANDVDLTSDTDYIINSEKGYIYTGLDTDPDIIKKHLSVENGKIEIKDNKVNVSSDKITKEYNLIYIMKSPDNENNYNKYLGEEYVYTKISEFKDSYIKTNIDTNEGITREIINDGNNYIFNIKYKEDILKTYKIITMTSEKYKIFGNYVYIEGEYAFDNIKISNAEIEENNEILNIKYNDEIIDSLTELKIDFGSLNVNGENISLIGTMTLEEIKKEIKMSNDLDIKIYKGTKEITENSEKIESGMEIKVINSKYGEIKTYKITDEYINIDELEIDEHGFVSKYNSGTTYKEILDNIGTSGSVKFIDNTGKELENSDIIRTGSKVVIELSTETKEYTIVVYGDINGDGKITMSDLVKSANYLVDETIISEDCYKEAIDVTKDGNVRMSDIIKLSNILIGSN